MAGRKKINEIGRGSSRKNGPPQPTSPKDNPPESSTPPSTREVRAAIRASRRSLAPSRKKESTTQDASHSPATPPNPPSQRDEAASRTELTISRAGRGHKAVSDKLDQKSEPSQPFLPCINEAKLAAHLGYDDIGQFRSFKFTWPVLKALQEFKEAKGCRTAIRPALELINDVGIEKVRAEQSGKFKAYTIAKILDQFLSDVAIMENQRNKGLNPMLFRSVRDTFHTWLGDRFAKGVYIPDIDIEKTQVPNWGPRREFNEHPIEPWARAGNVILSLEIVTHLSKFKSTGGMHTYLSPNAVHESQRPTYMVEEPQGIPQLLQKSLTEPSIFLLQPHINKMRQTLQSKMGNSCPSWLKSSGSIEFKLDPQELKAAYWRDEIRRHLEFDKLWVDFLFITMKKHLPGTSTTQGPRVLYGTQEECSITWQEFQQELRKYPGSYILSFEVVEIDEEDTYPYEYDGPPPALMQDLALNREGDVVIVPAPNQETEEEAVQVQKVMSAGAPRVIPSYRMRPTDGWDLSNPQQKQQFLSHYDGYDVSKPAELRKWQLSTLEKCMGKQTQRLTREQPLGKRPVGKQTREGLNATFKAIEQHTLKRDEQDYDIETIESLYQETNINTGPRVEVARMLLNMRSAGSLPDKPEHQLNACNDIERCTATFLDCQVNGAAWMMAKTFGYVPISRTRYAELEEGVGKATSSVRDSYKVVQTRGGLLCDGTGMGKTRTALLYLSHKVSLGPRCLSRKLRPTYPYKPNMILCPSNTVLMQWADLIRTQFKNLEVVIVFGGHAPRPSYEKNFLKASAVNNCNPSDQETWKQLPEHLRYIWDQKNPNAGKIVILTTYGTMAARLATPVKASKKPTSKKRKQRKFANRWAAAIDTVMMDEGHKLRRRSTRLHKLIVALQADYHWFITATPIVNTALDILGPLDILQRGAEKVIEDNEEVKDWIKHATPGIASLQEAAAFEPTDLRKLILLKTDRISRLLQAEQTSLISEVWPAVDELICLRRSTGSELQYDDGPHALDNLMPKYGVETRMLDYLPTEKAEVQWQHRAHARNYVQSLKKMIEHNKGEARSSLKDKKKKGASLIAQLRRLCMITASPLLGRFDLYLHKIGQKTLAANIDSFRCGGRNLKWFLRIATLSDRNLDVDTMTQSDLLQRMCWGSPKARAICGQLLNYVLPNYINERPRKILFAEDTVPVAWFWELLLCNLFVPTAVLHSKLNATERFHVVDSFNHPENELCCLVAMYGMSTQGTNFHQACNRVVILTPAVNAPTEIQQWGRIIRISQREDCLIVRFKCVNSHDQYRDSKQSDKMLIELAMRAYDSRIQNVLVQLLNEHQDEVNRAHDNQNEKVKRAEEEAEEEALRTSSDAIDGVNNSKSDITEAGTTNERLQRLMKQGVVMSTGKRRRNEPDRSFDKPYLANPGYAATGIEEEFQGPATKRSKITEETTQYEHEDENSVMEGECYSDEEFVEESEVEDDVSDCSVSEEFDPNEDDDDDDDEGEDNDDDDDDDEYDEILPDFEHISLTNASKKQVIEKYWSMNLAEIEAASQDDLNERNLLRYQYGRVYNVNDLRDDLVLERALRLLFQARFGQQEAGGYWRLSPHINYTALPGKVVEAIENSTISDKKQIEQTFRTSKR